MCKIWYKILSNCLSQTLTNFTWKSMRYLDCFPNGHFCSWIDLLKLLLSKRRYLKTDQRVYILMHSGKIVNMTKKIQISDSLRSLKSKLKYFIGAAVLILLIVAVALVIIFNKRPSAPEQSPRSPNDSDDELIFAHTVCSVKWKQFFGYSICMEFISFQICRHGDRNSYPPYPNDQWKSLDYWPEGYAQLTKVVKPIELLDNCYICASNRKCTIFLSFSDWKAAKFCIGPILSHKICKIAWRWWLFSG